MKTLTTLIVGGLVGGLLATVTLTALTGVINPTAVDVARRDANQSQYDVSQPPAFYGSR
ncbi:MAG TPA: hypothetical protein VJT31_38450 [Rugosimonospora sp.]|nr:hypothetical protein [Rugosimonospora sp.]